MFIEIWVLNYSSIGSIRHLEFCLLQQYRNPWVVQSATLNKGELTGQLKTVWVFGDEPTWENFKRCRRKVVLNLPSVLSVDDPQKAHEKPNYGEMLKENECSADKKCVQIPRVSHQYYFPLRHSRPVSKVKSQPERTSLVIWHSFI